VIEGPEDVALPGITLEEILRGLKNDAQSRRVRDRLLSDLSYLAMRQSLFIQSAQIYRVLRAASPREAGVNAWPFAPRPDRAAT
jgi:predicted nucleic acid-binding protein